MNIIVKAHVHMRTYVLSFSFIFFSDQIWVNVLFLVNMHCLKMSAFWSNGITFSGIICMLSCLASDYHLNSVREGSNLVEEI